MPSQKRTKHEGNLSYVGVPRMFPLQTSRTFLIALAAFLGACGGPAVQQEPSSAETAPTSSPSLRDVTPRAPAPRSWAAARVRRVVLRSQGLAVELPEPDAWDALPRRGAWSGLQHQPTGSELWIRHVPARRTVKVAECEAESRTSFALLRHGEFLDHERRLNTPSGYGGVVNVILPPGGGGLIEAFGVGVSRCLAVVFVSGDKPGFPERLQFATNQILSSLQVSRPGVNPGREAPSF